MREFAVEHTYEVSVRRLVLLWRDPAFLTAVGSRYGGTAAPEIIEQGERVVVRRRRELPMERLPGFVRRVMSGSTIVQSDSWPLDLASDTVEGEWSVEGHGIPARMAGTQRVAAAGEGCRCLVSGTVMASVPLVGGRAEELVAREVCKLIAREQDLAAQWLADHPRPS